MGKLFQAYEDKDKAVLAQVGEYCMIDSVRLQQLVYCDATKIIESLISLALVVYCPLEYVYYRGQQVKVMAQIVRTADKLGFRIPDHVIDLTLGDSRPRKRYDEDGYICNDAVADTQMPSLMSVAGAADEEDDDDDPQKHDDEDRDADRKCQAAAPSSPTKRKVIFSSLQQSYHCSFSCDYLKGQGKTIRRRHCAGTEHRLLLSQRAYSGK